MLSDTTWVAPAYHVNGTGGRRWEVMSRPLRRRRGRRRIRKRRKGEKGERKEGRERRLHDHPPPAPRRGPESRVILDAQVADGRAVLLLQLRGARNTDPARHNPILAPPKLARLVTDLDTFFYIPREGRIPPFSDNRQLCKREGFYRQNSNGSTPPPRSR